MPDSRSDPGHSFLKCEAVKVAYRQTKDGMVVSFAIHPNEMPPELALAPVGTRVLLAVAEIGDGERPAAPPPGRSMDQVMGRAEPVKNDAARERGKERYLMSDDGEKAVIRAGILPKDKAFQRQCGAEDEVAAAAFIRAYCGVKSRKELASNERAYNAFRDIEFQFHGHAEIRS